MPALKGQKKVGGRAKGTPNKVTAQIKTMIENALTKAGGEEYLARQAEENPPAFMGLVGRALPLQVSGDPEKPLLIITRAE